MRAQQMSSTVSALTAVESATGRARIRGETRSHTSALDPLLVAGTFALSKYIDPIVHVLIGQPRGNSDCSDSAITGFPFVACGCTATIIVLHTHSHHLTFPSVDS